MTIIKYILILLISTTTFFGQTDKKVKMLRVATPLSYTWQGTNSIEFGLGPKLLLDAKKDHSNISLVAAGNYFMDRVEVNSTLVTVYKQPNQQLVGWWPLNNLCYGTDASNPMTLNNHYQEFVTNPVAAGTNAVAAAMRSYCYYIKYDIAGQVINKWWPCEPYQVTFRYSAHLKDITYVGIKENENLSNGNISIYPNPTSNVFFINASGEYKMGKNDKYEVYSVSGQLIYSDKITSNTTAVDISDLSNGIYVVKAYISNSVSINKVVKNN